MSNTTVFMPFSEVCGGKLASNGGGKQEISAAATDRPSLTASNTVKISRTPIQSNRINDTPGHHIMETLLRDLLLDPLQYTFMQRALLAAILTGITSGVMGAYVVTRGMSFLGDALAHSVLPGVAVAFISGNNTPAGLLIGGLIAGIRSATGIGILTRRRRLLEDTAIGIVFA